MAGATISQIKVGNTTYDIHDAKALPSNADANYALAIKNQSNESNILTVGWNGNVNTTGGATFTGALTAASATLSGQLKAKSASITNAITAKSASITDAVTAASATLSGQLKSDSASITNAMTAGSVASNGGLSVKGNAEMGGIIDLHNTNHADGKDYMARINQSGGTLTFTATDGGYAEASIPSRTQMALLSSGSLRRRLGNKKTDDYDSWHYIEYEPVTEALDLDNSCAPYDKSTYLPRVIRWGCVCQLVGAAKPKKKVAANGTLTIGSISTAYRPLYEVNVLCQGSWQSSYLLTVTHGGVVTASRYQNGGGTYVAIETDMWLAFSTMWLMPSG